MNQHWRKNGLSTFFTLIIRACLVLCPNSKLILDEPVYFYVKNNPEFEHKITCAR